MDIELVAQITCKRCGVVLGYATPQGVRIGEVVFRADVALCCARCDTTRLWRMTRKRDIVPSQISRRGTDPATEPRDSTEMSARIA